MERGSRKCYCEGQMSKVQSSNIVIAAEWTSGPFKGSVIALCCSCHIPFSVTDIIYKPKELNYVATYRETTLTHKFGASVYETTRNERTL